jgi:hypothetical protein
VIPRVNELSDVLVVVRSLPGDKVGVQARIAKEDRTFQIHLSCLARLHIGNSLTNVCRGGVSKHSVEFSHCKVEHVSLDYAKNVGVGVTPESNAFTNRSWHGRDQLGVNMLAKFFDTDRHCSGFDVFVRVKNKVHDIASNWMRAFSASHRC